MREKLILPEEHRELLDILTTDLDDYVDDIVAGKSAGNVILTRGRPGVGKTLTAEAYSEIVKRPLYKVRSGSLGTSPEQVEKGLETIFSRAARWDAVLLLDEADVFIRRRGESIIQNAICAEFLRAIKYFNGLMFMTTNRSDEVDEAIYTRCAAIITYDLPTPENARAIWGVMVRNAQAEDLVPEEMRNALVEKYPSLPPRDIKMVLRLALRLSRKRSEKPSMETFARCLMFRGLA